MLIVEYNNTSFAHKCLLLSQGTELVNDLVMWGSHSKPLHIAGSKIFYSNHGENTTLDVLNLIQLTLVFLFYFLMIDTWRKKIWELLVNHLFCSSHVISNKLLCFVPYVSYNICWLYVVDLGQDGWLAISYIAINRTTMIQFCFSVIRATTEIGRDWSRQCSKDAL